MEDFKSLGIGFLIGLIVGVMAMASGLSEYEKIQKSSKGYVLEHGGKIYQLVEIPVTG